MLDFSHLPNPRGGADVQLFRNPGQFSTWVKPRGKSMFNAVLISGGAGGGGGFSRTAGTAGGGGGGGGPGSIATLVLPISFLPDILYVQVGAGGNGGAAAAAGAAGNISFLTTYPDIATISYRVMASALTAASGGGAGSAAAAGAAGSAGGVMTSNQMNLGSFGVFSVSQGCPATAGGAQTGAAGVNQAYVGFVIFGGTGGAGATTTDFAGGLYAAAGVYPNMLGGTAGGGRGTDGYEMTASGVFMPLPSIFLPGTGGGSNNAATGGAGGNGGPGCGGGGGGAGVTGGAGGRGGDGLVIISSW